MLDKATTPLNPNSDYNTNSSKANINSIQNYLQNALSYTYSRLPNVEEIALNSIPKAFIDVLLGDFVLKFGENPTSASFVRDFIKIPGSIAVVYRQTEIGGTGIKHDTGSLYALGGRAFCKVTFIGAGSYFLGYDQDILGRFSNYPCDSISRYFYIVSRERQTLIKENPELDKISYHEFLTTNFKSSWILEAIGEGFTKTFVADIISEKFIKNIGYTGSLRTYANNFEAKFMESFFDKTVEFANKADIWTKINTYSQLFTNEEGKTDYAKAALSSFLTFITDFSGKLVSETTSASILMPPTRITQDFIGKHIKETINYFYSDEPVHEEIAHLNTSIPKLLDEVMTGLVESDSEL